MKVESRGKYPGVKLHLEPEEVDILLKLEVPMTVNLAGQMRQKIKALIAEDPDLLKERSPERIQAALAKEIEKSSLQLAQVKAGKSHKKVNPEELKKALLKHAEG